MTTLPYHRLSQPSPGYFDNK